ncbi:hypothetical protein NST83_05385 [Paenibacillus sp. FSL R10-2782]|uniref:hypothetical protein n=1 Tax=Paenibacillus sp. FSL R10-2782 TaxID=2954661 RepID=UPI003158BF45
MPIYEAIYRNEENEELVLINTFESHPEFEVARNNLFCVFENCPAKLEYVPKGKRKEHFKTWPKHNHIQDCLDYFEREKVAQGNKNSATATMALTDKHISNILNEIKRKRKQKENEGQLHQGNKKTKKKRTNVDTSLPATSNININPTTGPDAVLQEGEGGYKAPPVRRRNLTLLNNDDIGFTRSLEDATIEQIEIDDERVVFKVSNGQRHCNIYFEEFFFTNSPVNFLELLKQLKEIVDKSNLKFYFSCVGEVVKRDDSVHMLINRNTHFRVDDQYLPVFLHTL